MIRALLDANIYVSYLLTRGASGTVAQVVRWAINGVYIPLLPAELLQEMQEVIARKKTLSSKIKPEDVWALTSVLLQIGEQIPPVREEVDAVSRDPRDTYLLAYAVVAQADYLVTGDMDLLVLDPVGPVRIVRPADFLDILSQQLHS
ncbi:MAG TPA: putative toxin-antitoxin system toxin component, PIN family [Chloroflexia bacterium]|jgi:hypothetical protein